MTPSTPQRLGNATWPDVGSPVVVVPVGSCEQHGPHLPLHTDTVIAEALARALCERRPCVVAPSLTITASGEHQGFAGTLSIGSEAMTSVVIELVRSADWSSGVVLVNGHGGNAGAVSRAVEVLRAEARRVLAWWPKVADGDLHAGHVETSLMLYLAPNDVQLERATVGPTPTMQQLVRSGVQAMSASGVLGDPTLASAAEGERLFTVMSEQLDDAVARWIERQA